MGCFFDDTSNVKQNIKLAVINIGLGVAIFFIMKLHNLDLKQSLLIGLFIYLPAILIPNLMPMHARFMAWVFANRSPVALLVLLVSGLAGSIFFIQSGYFTKGIAEFSIHPIRQFVAGLLVGAGMRILLALIGFYLLFRVQAESEKAMLLAGYCVALLLFPSSTGSEKSLLNQSFAGIYIFGIGVGFCLQYFIRTNKHISAERDRMRDRVLTMLGKHQKELDHIEANAVELLVRRKFKSLKKLIEKHNNEPTANLIIIKACMERVKGDYKGCSLTLDEGLKITDKSDNIDAAMTLLKALVLGEIVNKEDEMWAVLDKARDKNPNCSLIRGTRALRLAEKLSINRADSPGDRMGPLNEILFALQLNKMRDHPIIDKAIGHSIPVTLGFLLDAYGYALLISGDFQFSRSLLIQCIRDDPIYSSPYLHLGEWYLTRYEALMSHGDHEEGSRLLRPAEYCLLIAQHLQKKLDSRIRRRSREFLNKYFGKHEVSSTEKVTTGVNKVPKA